MTTATKKTGTFVVRSQHFDWHAPEPAATYADALALAKARGFDANIYTDANVLVATWSALYGARVYHRAAAGLVPALRPVSVRINGQDYAEGTPEYSATMRRPA